MKIRTVFLPLLLVPLIGACNSSSNKTQLTFGSYVTEGGEEISSGEFDSKLTKENFLFAVHPSLSPTCGCWTTFRSVINASCQDFDIVVYLMESANVTSSMKELGISDNGNEPSFYIINEGKVAKKYVYDVNNRIFKDENKFITEIKNNCNLARLKYVTLTQLTTRIVSESPIVLFERSGCSDCQYVIPNVLIPYIKTYQGDKEILVYDLQADYNTPQYQAIKDTYGLSIKGNETYGYSTGVVPTFQKYDKGSLIDASVYVNDTITKVEEGKYKVSETYYTSERIASLKYATGMSSLLNKELNKDDVDEITYPGGVYYSWNYASSSKSHNPFLKAFLDKYLTI